jgi:hypothetical protein
VKRHSLIAAAAGIVLAAPGPAWAQIPDKYTNLQVLPKDISKGELISTMREMAGSLGMRCVSCHVGPDNLEGMDFATDDKGRKRTARAMLKMVNDINGKYLEGVQTEGGETTRVRCMTCHRGLNIPRGIDEVLAQTIESKGVEAALAEYRGLRDKYYGSAAYDFSPGPLNYMVEQLARKQKLDDAVAIAKANVELHPDVAYAYAVLGRLHAAREEREPAIAALRRAVELDPSNAQAKKQLEELEAAAAEKKP